MLEQNDVRRIKKYIGLGTFLISLIVYLMTVAPTTSYWDCGEFIATSRILGIPHPPGAPFFLLLGRVFSMLPIASDIGLRVNLISVFASSFTVLFLYLITIRLIAIWRGPVQDKLDIIIVFGASAVGALTYAFTDTFWFNAVEAEVYALSMFFTSFIIWALLKWVENHEDLESTKYILLIMLLVGLGTGVHLLNILTLPPALFLMWFYNRRLTVIFGVGMVLSIIVLFALEPHIKLYSLFIFVIIAFFLYRSENQDVSLAVIAPILLIIGYSSYLMIYIRAGLNPPINENDPSNIERFIAYLSRKQYGDTPQLRNAVYFMLGEENRAYLESVAKMGISAGSEQDPWKSHFNFFWQYQVVEMYIRYFNWQFVGKNIENIKQVVTLKGLYGVPFLIGLWGAISHFFKDWKRATTLFALFLVLGLGLIIYQNQDWGQPRERDYFYVGSFFIFSIWIGLGINFILDALKSNKIYRNLIIPVFAVSLLVPYLELQANYHTGDRTGNYLAWDYSKNILESCDKNAVLYTNGDNDTFPLWYLQEVEGIRTDVTILNLSLLNTDWYIKQMKEKVPELITYSTEYIEKNFNQETMDVDVVLKRLWQKPREMEIPSRDKNNPIKWKMEPTMYITLDNEPTGMIKVQDQMVLHILSNNAKLNWKYPICFAVTVSSKNYIGLDNYMRMDGLVYSLVDYEAKKSIEPEVLYDRLFSKFRDHYRNLGDKNVYYDDNNIRLLQNYRSAFMQLATNYIDDRQLSMIVNDSVPEVDVRSEIIDKELSFDQFENLSDREKIAYVLNWMDRFVPSSNIPYSNTMILPEIAGLFRYSGFSEKGNELLGNANIEKLDFDKKIEFLVRASRYGLNDFVENTLKKMSDDVKGEKNIDSKIKNSMDLYLVTSQINKPQILEDMRKEITEMIDKITSNRDRLQAYIEWSVAMYSAGDSKNAVSTLEKVGEEYEDVQCYTLIYQIHMRDQNKEKAMEAIDKVLSMDPENVEYKKRREALAFELGK
ncbi:MAG: DUF2723 domain-containing protein [Candidatus Delongbacteria bacterium]|nr:DUF2723 domain-containing protein [Candidatus Delongbacteria bacterium]MBN2835092.1 DUF2723 domain-containing protein [Candidatus Delongbacteria bacterium]